MKYVVLMLTSLLVACNPYVAPIKPVNNPAPIIVTSPDSIIGIGNVKIWVGTNEGLLSGGGYYAGAQAEAMLPIHNQGNQDAQVNIIVEPPPKQTRVIRSDGSLDYDYQVAPSQVVEWVTIEDSKPIIPANSIKEVLVILKVPKGTQLPDKWEFRVTVIPMGQGTTETAVSQRWLIKMR